MRISPSQSSSTRDCVRSGRTSETPRFDVASVPPAGSAMPSSLLLRSITA